MWFLEEMNKWAMDFSPLIQLLMLIAVSAATITALWSTWKIRQDKKIQVEYECDISSILIPQTIESDGTTQYKKSHETVSAKLTNTGLRTTGIPWLSFGLIIPTAKKHSLLQPVTDYRDESPLPLPPGGCVTLELRTPEQLRKEILRGAPEWFPRLHIRRLRLTFATDGGDVFRAKIGKELRTYINETAAQTNLVYQKQRVEK